MSACVYIRSAYGNGTDDVIERTVARAVIAQRGPICSVPFCDVIGGVEIGDVGKASARIYIRSAHGNGRDIGIERAVARAVIAQRGPVCPVPFGNVIGFGNERAAVIDVGKASAHIYIRAASRQCGNIPQIGQRAIACAVTAQRRPISPIPFGDVISGGQRYAIIVNIAKASPHVEIAASIYGQGGNRIIQRAIARAVASERRPVRPVPFGNVIGFGQVHTVIGYIGEIPSHVYICAADGNGIDQSVCRSINQRAVCVCAERRPFGAIPPGDVIGLRDSFVAISNVIEKAACKQVASLHGKRHYGGRRLVWNRAIAGTVTSERRPVRPIPFGDIIRRAQYRAVVVDVCKAAAHIHIRAVHEQSAGIVIKRPIARAVAPQRRPVRPVPFGDPICVGQGFAVIVNVGKLPAHVYIRAAHSQSEDRASDRAIAGAITSERRPVRPVPFGDIIRGSQNCAVVVNVREGTAHV